MDRSPEEPSSPRSPATPESPLMSDSMVERTARSILLHLEALAATPLVDTRQISLVDFTLDSPDLKTSPENKASPQHHSSCPPRRRLFHSPGNAPDTTEDVLNLVEEELGGFSLCASSPLHSCPRSPANETSFTIDTEGFEGNDIIATSTPCLSPCPGDTAADEAKKSGTGALAPGISATGSGDAASSEVLLSRDPTTTASGGAEGALQLSDESALPTSSSPATVKDGTFILAADGPADSNGVGDASPDDGDLYGTRLQSLPALGESFVIARDCSPSGEADDEDRSPGAEDTFVSSAAPSVAAKPSRPSAKGKEVVPESLPPPRLAPLQRPAARLSVATKPRAASERPTAVGGQPKAIPVRPDAATRAGTRTTLGRGTQASARPSITFKGVEQQKTASTSEVPKPGRRTMAPSAVAKQPAARPTPTLPEPRKLLGPHVGATSALKSLQPVRGATNGTTRASTARLPTGSTGAAPRPALPGARRSVAALPRATSAASEPVPVPAKGKSGLCAAPSVQPPQKPHSRLRPPNVIQESDRTSRVPRPAFGKVPCVPSQHESPELDQH